MRATATKLSFSVLVNKLLCLVTSAMLNPKLSSEAKSVSESMDQNDKKNEELFDPSVTPPFTISEVRAAIPIHCWKKSSLRSMLYFVRDIACVISLAAFAHFFCKSWWIWVLYWFVQGTFFWAIFVIGHDCGHGSFSDNKTLNSLVGHLAHSFTLVPYNGWRISHKTHHQNHGHVENDESWNPLPEKMYKSISTMHKITRFTLPWPLTALPAYLMLRSPGKQGSCFNPDSDLFAPSERKGVIISTLCWLIMASLLVGASILYGPALVIKFYGIPYWVFVAWFCLVTYLNHQGHEHKIPWYRGKEWSYLRGALSTIDRDYGIFNDIHHNIGTHVIHHLFPQIPHYHLIEATDAAKHVLGKYYRAPHKNSIIPVELIKVFDKSLSEDHFVRDEGDIVFYETDYSLHSPAKIILSYVGSKIL